MVTPKSRNQKSEVKMARPNHAQGNAPKACFTESGTAALKVIKRLVPLMFSIAFLGGTDVTAQPLRGEEARRWQSAWNAAQQGRHQEALDGFKSVLEKKADQGLYLQAGALLARQGAQAQAEELYLWGRKTLKQPRAFADRLAEIYQSQLRHDRAVAEWMSLLPDRADLVGAKLVETSQHIGLKNTAALAEANLKGAGDAGWLVLGGLHLSARDDRQAWRAFSRIRDPGLLRKAVDQVLAAGLPASRQIPALEEYLAKSGGKEQDLLARLGSHYMGTRQFQKASDVFSKMLPLNRPLATVLSARALLGQGNHAEALRTISDGGAAKGWPDTLRWEARLLEAQARLMSGEGPAAAGLLAVLAGDSSARADFRQRAAFKLAETHLMSGRADSALAGYRRAVDLGMGGEPSNDALLRMILISEHKADRMEALTDFGRGLGEKARGDYSAAARSLSQVAEGNPGTSLADQAMLELALMRQEQGEFRQAAEAWSRLAEAASDSVLSCRASYRQGMVLRYELDKPGEAAGVWKRAVVRYPDFSWSDLMRQELTGY